MVQHRERPFKHNRLARICCRHRLREVFNDLPQFDYSATLTWTFHPFANISIRSSSAHSSASSPIGEGPGVEELPVSHNSSFNANRDEPDLARGGVSSLVRVQRAGGRQGRMGRASVNQIPVGERLRGRSRPSNRVTEADLREVAYLSVREAASRLGVSKSFIANRRRLSTRVA
jgi:hypothetical protein